MSCRRHTLAALVAVGWLAAPSFAGTAARASDAPLAGGSCPTSIGGIELGGLQRRLLVFTDGATDANWQSASKGYAGDVAVNGLLAQTRTSGTLAYAGTIATNAAGPGAWQRILGANLGQATVLPAQTALLDALDASLDDAFAQVDALAATPGFESRTPASLDGLDSTDGRAETIVVNVTSQMKVSSQIAVTGDAGDVYVLRWDEDADASNGYDGEVKFQSGGAIVPLGGLTAGNFVHVAGDINASGGGATPAAPYPQGPRLDGGRGALIGGGQDFSGGGFFTGYWLTTGEPGSAKTSSLSNAIFVGGWYSSAKKFSLTSGTSGVHVCPPAAVDRSPAGGPPPDGGGGAVLPPPDGGGPIPPPPGLPT